MVIASTLLAFFVTASQAAHTAVPGRIPLHFEPNLGQTHAGVQYVGRGGGIVLLLRSSEAVLKLTRRLPRIVSASVTMKLKGANPDLRGELVEELPSISAYYLGNDPAKWLGRVPHYGKVRYRELYAGVDLVYYGVGGRLEYDFEVQPGADPSKIRLAYEGAERMYLDAAGDLVLTTKLGDLRQHKPRVYQDVRGRRVEVAGSYRLEGDGVTFALAEYDRSQILTIDPVVSYATVLGGASAEEPFSISVDAAGAAYVAGYTGSLDFPFPSGTPAVNGDGFVAKFSPHTSGSVTLAYVLYLGSSGNDAVLAMTADSAGAVYACGAAAAADFPALHAHRLPLSTDAFAVKVNPHSSGPVSLSYATFLGANPCMAVAVDPSGGAYFAGTTTSPSLPLLNALQADQPGADATLVKLQPYTGFGTVAVAYSTYLGGSGADVAKGIAVDGTGAAYLVGETDSADFPLLHPFQGISMGKREIFVAKVGPNNGSGSASLVYSTYFGTPEDDSVGTHGAIALDGSGAAYIAGTSFGSFPRLSHFTNYSPTFANYVPQAALIRFAPYSGSGSLLLSFSTPLPEGFGSSVCAGPAGSVYAGGNPDPRPLVNMHYSPAILKFSPQGGSYVTAYAASYPTPPGPAEFHGCAVDSQGSVYILARPHAPVPLVNNYPTPGGGFSDALIVKLKDGVPGATAPVTVTSNPAGVSFSVAGSGCPTGTYNASAALSLPTNGDCRFQWPDTIPQSAGRRWRFGAWTDNPALNPRTITVTGPSTIGALYVQQYELSVNVQPLGAGVVRRWSGGPIVSTAFFDADSWFQLQPAPNNCYEFLRWSGDLSGSEVPYSFTLGGPMTITALFSGYSNAQSGFTAAPGAIRYNQFTGRYTQAVVVANNTASSASVALAVDNLVPGAILYGPSGLTSACTIPAGSPYRIVGTLAPGQRITAQLEFQKPANLVLSYTPRILIGVAQ